MQPGAERPFQRARLRYDDTFALELGYCYEKGIPHSRFLEEWDAEDRAKVAAFAMEKAEKCFRCGTAPHEWAEDPDAYVAVAMGCPGCLRLETMSEDLHNTPGPKGAAVRLLPRSAAERLRAETERRAAEGTLRPRRRRREQL